MLQIQDQIDIYILKYKEELFKNSSNSIKNQEIIQNLRDYFDRARESGEFELQKALNRLMSPQSLAIKHLNENGIKASKRRGFFSYAFFLSIFLLSLLIISILGLFYVVFPYFESTFENDVVSWEIKYGGDFGFGKEIEALQGNISVTNEQRFFVEARALNAEFKTSSQDYIFYKCEYNKGEAPTVDFTEKTTEQVSMNFVGKPAPRKCVFEIPEKLVLAIEAETVNLEITKWNHALQIKSKTGNLSINLDSSISYDLNVYVEQGNLQGLKSFSSIPGGQKVEVYLQQGNLVLTPY